jgi:Fe-S oxidoreductase
VPEIPTYFDYTDQESFEGAVEMCNGAGFCRKTAGGTMCPSYRATMDERHSTRGRGNALRLAISGQLRRDRSGKPDFTDDGTMETLDLCLACKACKSECPSNVDIARLKAEYMAQRWRVKGTPLYARVFGHVRTLNKFGAMAPGLANWVKDIPQVRRLMNRALGLAEKRSLPNFARSLFATAKRRAGPRAGKPRVVLYGDCFVAYNDPHIGHAAIRVLGSLGYDVVLPSVGCCGRAMISTGLLKDAARSADQTIAQLQPYIEDDDVVAVVVAEPSCLASFKDDWLTLKMNTPLLLREKLAAKSFLVEEFVDRFWEQHPNKPTTQQLDGPPVILHGHCHQKALWGDITSAGVLKRIVGDRLQVLPSGCCGMAGSFGYMEHRYDVSMKIGELSVFPPIRAAGGDAIIVAPGTSCRHQIHDGTGHTAIHPIELLAKLLGV